MAQTVTVLGGSLDVEMAENGGGGGGGGGGSPPSIWPGVPAHPIVLPPTPPPGVWPPPVPAHPIVPAPPGTPPGMIWPSPGHPAHPIAPPEGPSTGPVPPSGGTPGHPLPTPFWTLALIPGYGWYYLCVDPGLAFAVDPPTVQPV